MTVTSCPFCGGRAKAYVDPVLPHESWGVGCTACTARLTAFGSEAAAVAAWNGRVPNELAGEASRRLIEACEAVLIFHGAAWTPAAVRRWYEVTQDREATTRVLCNAVRVALGLVEHVRAGGDDSVASFWALWTAEDRRRGMEP